MKRQDTKDECDLTELVHLAKKKIKEKTVGTLDNVKTLNSPRGSGQEHAETECKFFIDTTPQDWSSTSGNLHTTMSNINCDAVEDSNNVEDKSPTLKFKRTPEQIELASRLDPGISTDGIYIQFADSNNAIQKQPQNYKKVLEKSVITSDFEKRHSIPSYSESKAQIRKKKKKEKESSSGSGWFDMKAAEMNEDLRRDLKLIQMRSILDPKRFYKNNDMKNIPKFVQIGKVVDSHVDFYNDRVPKKQRKTTIVDELLADAELRQQNKRKYLELQQKTMYKYAKGKKGKKKKTKETN